MRSFGGGRFLELLRGEETDGRVDELADILATLALEHDIVEARYYRDAIGLGRKRTIQILEFFDRVGYTRRIGDSHIVRRDSGWRSAAHEIAAAR